MSGFTKLVSILVIFSCWGTWTIAWAQEPGAAEPGIAKADTPRGAISGTVINSVTGEPINRAVVQLAGLDRAAMTDASGHFEFHNLQGDRILFIVSKPGFFYEQNHPETLAEIEASALVLRMAPAGAISGKITTQGGEPIEGIGVKAVQRQTLAGRQVWVDRVAAAQTDENGNFRIAGLPQATYVVATEQSREPVWMPSPIPNSRMQVYAQSFYPGVSQLSIASPIDLAAGQEVETDFSLTAEPTYKVAGALAGLEEISSGAVFKRQAGEDFDFLQSISVQNGRFETELPAGSYTVDAYTAQIGRASISGSSLVISSDISDVRIPLNSGISIPVIIRADSDGNSPERVEDSTAHTMIEVRLRGVSNAPSLYNREAWWTGPHASEISSVEAGRYEVELTAFGQWRVESAKCGGIDLLSNDLMVTAGSQPAAIEITLRNDGATVVGTVALEPSKNTTVLLVQPRGAKNFVEMVTTAMGNFRFAGLAPGEYSLIASDGLDKLEYMNPEVLNPYLSTAARISLQPHAIANVTLNVSRASR